MMIDGINTYMDSPLSWVLLMTAALFVGMSKTGIQGITILAIPFLAMGFGAKPSTGIMLPILCFADLIAVIYYRRKAEWKYIWKLLPMALLGFCVALAVDKMIPAREFKHLMGGCLLLVLAVMMWNQWKGKDNKYSDRWWYGTAFGLLGGFCTMIGNAAGPIMAIYLLSLHIPKMTFVGTNAWFFLCVNYLKLPFQIFAWHNINATTLLLDLCAIPAVIIGAIIGIRIVKILPEKGFRIFVTTVTFISVLMMLLN